MTQPTPRKMVLPPSAFGAFRPPMGGGAPKPLSKILFEKYDKDNSGEIDSNEFRLLCQEMGYRLTEEQIKWAIVDIDDSGNGLIGYDEFMKWWKKDERVKSMQLDDEAIFFRANAYQIFIQFDKNNDGSIDNQEFGAFYASLVERGLTNKDRETAKRDLDESNDGEIQFNEFMRWLQRNQAPRKQSLLAEYMEKHLPAQQPPHNQQQQHHQQQHHHHQQQPQQQMYGAPPPQQQQPQGGYYQQQHHQQPQQYQQQQPPAPQYYQQQPPQGYYPPPQGYYPPQQYHQQPPPQQYHQQQPQQYQQQPPPQGYYQQPPYPGAYPPR